MPTTKNKRWARDGQPPLLSEHVDWILGDEVAGLRAVRLAGDETVSTSWLVVLRYELEVRREDMKQLHSHGATLTEAFGTGRDK